MSLPVSFDHVLPWRAFDEFRTGLALHYPFLFSAVVGIEAQRTFEFGAGISTRVFLDAHTYKRYGHHVSVSTEQCEDIVRNHLDGVDRSNWTHHTGLSTELPYLAESDMFDVVLHDGSHSTDVVVHDLCSVIPHIRQYGLLLIHDTLHSYNGESMRQAVSSVLPHFAHARVTLPYGFGLTIVQILGNIHLPPVSPRRNKVGSSHYTVLKDV